MKSVDVTSSVAADVAAGRAYSQYRLRFYQEVILPILDHENDFVRFIDGEGTGGSVAPRLVVRYQP